VQDQETDFFYTTLDQDETYNLETGYYQQWMQTKYIGQEILIY
jgi:hypothetical protein